MPKVDRHQPGVSPVEAPGRQKLYVGRCLSCPESDFVGKRRRTPVKAMQDAQQHCDAHGEHGRPYEMTLIIRVDAHSYREAIIRMRRHLIRLAIRRSDVLARSLASGESVIERVES